MTAPINASFDFAALASLKNDARAQDPAALKEAAKQFESLFTKMLLKSMRDANKGFGEDSLFGSQQGDFYQDMFDDQMAMHLSNGKGLGLADMLVQQLTQAGMVKPADAAGQATSKTQFSLPAQGISGADDHQPLSASKADFVRTMWPHAQRAGSQLGVDPHALVAQAALETGWGKSVPSQSGGSSSFNLFGIKAGSSWSGATATVPTLEFEDGVAVRRVERFRAYDSPADSFSDYARLIRNNPRYEDAVGAGGDVASFASALQAGGYATDPSYAQKVVAVADEVRSLTSSPGSTQAPVETFKSAALLPLHGGGGKSGLRRF
jgi:flagellar protein FlgJ